MSDCKDHSEVEPPWMCECTRKRIAELEAYRHRMELAIGCAETSIADEVIRRKQAEALRWAGEYLVMSQSEKHMILAFGFREVVKTLAAAIESGDATALQARE